MVSGGFDRVVLLLLGWIIFLGLFFPVHMALKGHETLRGQLEVSMQRQSCHLDTEESRQTWFNCATECGYAAGLFNQFTLIHHFPDKSINVNDICSIVWQWRQASSGIVS